MEINIPFTNKVLRISIFHIPPERRGTILSISLSTIVMKAGTKDRYRETMIELALFKWSSMIDIVVHPHYDYTGEIEDEYIQ